MSSSSGLSEFTDENFEQEVLKSDRTVLVDFWAPDLVPCRLQEAHLSRLAREAGGAVKVGRVEAFSNPATTEAYRVKAVPHLMIVRAGQIVGELLGIHSLEALRARLQPLGLLNVV